jgi:hypothetical protein
MRERIQGRPLTPEEKYCVVTVKQYFDRNTGKFRREAYYTRINPRFFARKSGR